MEVLPALEAAEAQLLKQGKDEPTLVAYRQALGALSPANMEAWKVFGDLSTSRPLGMATGGIPQSEILAWFILRGRNVDRYLVAKLMALDRIFLGHQAEQAKKKK
jgi:hypothetical protein